MEGEKKTPRIIKTPSNSVNSTSLNKYNSEWCWCDGSFPISHCTSECIWKQRQFHEWESDSPPFVSEAEQASYECAKRAIQNIYLISLPFIHHRNHLCLCVCLSWINWFCMNHLRRHSSQSSPILSQLSHDHLRWSLPVSGWGKSSKRSESCHCQHMVSTDQVDLHAFKLSKT